MNIKIIENNGVKIAVIDNDEVIIKDGGTALDCAVNIGYEHDCRCLAIHKSAITEDFFKLSTGVAGEVVQKLVNYGYRLAIIGDFSSYTSKPLHDFIYESNNGKHLYFIADENEAAEKFTCSGK